MAKKIKNEDSLQSFKCNRCGGLGRVPLGQCAVCDGRGFIRAKSQEEASEIMDEKIKNVREMYKKTFGTLQ